MFGDSRLDRLADALAQHDSLRQPRAEAAAEAAVTLVVRPGPELDLLFIRRALHDADPWSGHIALPGGRRDVRDADLLETALRETAEETGLHLHPSGSLLGSLDEIVPGTTRLPPIIIAPFVVAAPADATAFPASIEVADTVWVPLASLRDESAASELLIELSDEQLRFPSLNYQGHVIWGLTHRILLQFLQIAERAGL
jgi:8-oxo-dGTP pyrophosphatase MutT (NUDIX family)